MIELLTLPVPADPATPVAPAAILGDAAPADFAALLGKVLPMPTTEIPPAAEAVTPAIAQISPIMPDAPAVETVPAVAATVASTLPTVAEPSEPATAAEAEPVKLPTLPVDFFAQRLPAIVKGAKAPKVEAKIAVPAKPDEDGVSEDDEEVPAVPTADVAALPDIAAPPPPVQAQATATPVSPSLSSSDDASNLPAPRPAEVAAAVPGEAPVIAHAETKAVDPLVPAERIEVAAPADIQTAAAPAEAAKATLDAGATETASSSTVTAPAAPSAFAAAAAVQPIAIAPMPAAPAPTMVEPAAPVSIALDDLMVAGASDSAWIDRLAGDITMLATGENREAHLRINPRSLGEMSIKLEVEGQHTRVHFTVETPQTLTMMADGTPRLVQLVEANGLKLDGATVDLDQRRDGRAASDQQQQQQAADLPRGAARAHDEAARAVSRTRIITATDRFA